MRLVESRQKWRKNCDRDELVFRRPLDVIDHLRTIIEDSYVKYFVVRIGTLTEPRL